VIWRSTTLRFAALVFFAQLAAAAVLLAGLGAVLRGRSDAEAAAAAETVRSDLLATHAQGGLPALARAIEFRRTQAMTGGEVMLLAAADGSRLAGNVGDWPPSVVPGGDDADVTLYRLGHIEPETMQVRATALPGGARLLTGMAIEGERNLLSLLERASLVALALALVFAALAAWLSARVVTARLAGTVETLRHVRSGSLAERVAPDGSGDAFAMLGEEVNRTLDRVTALIGELKIATDGLAHDLRSPLTRLRVALERAGAAVGEGPAQAAIERAQVEGDRLLGLVETALAISRAEAGLGRERFVEVDLAAMLTDIADLYAPVVEEAGRSIRVEGAGPLSWPVHRQLLDQALGNLIDNALKYGAGRITLAAEMADGETMLRVADEGVGIAANRRDEALRRFGRLDPARSGSGAGLGLALVQAVAHLHGGEVELGDAGPGLAVTIRLAAA
jgi:signal transduction histidine kinase